MVDKPSIYNIPANYHFFNSLFDHLNDSFAEDITKASIFLPNRRSCRQLNEIFLAKKKNAILPKIKAISDISYEDFFDIFENINITKEINEILKIQVIDGTDYLIFLADEVKNSHNFGENLSFDQALKIATKLRSLFDEVEFEGLDLKDLEEVDDSDLSLHRLVTLEFLKEFYVRLKNSLIKKNLLFPSAYQSYITNSLASLLSKYKIKNPIIIAGSTGSIKFNQNLIKAIYQQEQGSVILYGMTLDIYNSQFHPQFFTNELLSFLEVHKDDVTNIEKEDFLLSSRNRQNFLSTLNIPHEEIKKWQNLEENIDLENIKNDLENNFQIINAKNLLEESQLIALRTHQACQKNQSIAIISNNNNLLDLAKLELDKLSLFYNDTRNIGILTNPLIQFILSILELLESEFDSHSLLSLIKKPIYKDSNQIDLISKFEIKIVRSNRTKEGIIGIKEKISETDSAELKELVNSLLKDLSLIEDFPANGNLSLYINYLIKTVENLSGKNWLDLIKEQDCQIEIFEFFEKLKSKESIQIKTKTPLKILQTLLAQISFFKKSFSSAPIQILSTIEARLLNFDHIIIPSLNEGSFPEIEAENWLGKKIRKDLKIEKSLKKIGQNAYDFCNYLSSKSVTLSYHNSENNSPTIESPFLLKFNAICAKANIKLNQSKELFDLLSKIKKTKKLETEIANPKPNLKDRFNQLSITDIAKLLENPYEIYSKRILKLKKLKEIDFEPSYAEFGSFVHEALENYIKNLNTESNFINSSEKIFKKYFNNQDSKSTWWPKFIRIFNEFSKDNEQFLQNKNFVEIPVKLQIKDKLIVGKIDRIDQDQENKTTIFDYKTGQVPSIQDVKKGINPQLTISALAIIEGIVEDNLKNQKIENLQSLKYWKLSSFSDAEIKTICDKNDEIKSLISAAKSGLERLFEYFDNEENGYIATDKNDKSDYKHLSRIFN